MSREMYEQRAECKHTSVYVHTHAHTHTHTHTHTHNIDGLRVISVNVYVYTGLCKFQHMREDKCTVA